MPQRVRMFLDGLVRQPGDAISILVTTVRRLVLRGATASERGAMIHGHCGDLAEPSPLQAHTFLVSARLRFLETGWVPPSGTLVMPCDTDCVSD